ncbi:MAG: rRNA maturation RNase YbeY [Proteobacteria bacterium]|nr:rRNA maturation RNase YbeY [Pseudomonadota bacterium]
MATLRVRTSIEMRSKHALAQHGVNTTEVRALIRSAIEYGIEHKAYGLQGERFELALLVADDTALATLNYRFARKNSPTNVLAFPAAEYSDTERHYLGDIAISLETVEREAVLYGKTVRDRFMHMVAHGVLHLMGYDHITEQEREEMEQAEEDVLTPFAVLNIYNA